MRKEREMATWRELILKAIAIDGEDPSTLICTLADKEMDKKFDRGFGDSEGKPFTAWTENRVYFPCTYDGYEWVDSVPRNPCDEKTKHIGGE